MSDSLCVETNPLAKLAMRARKKFCKETTEKIKKVPKPAVSYVFVKSTKEQEIEELRKKVVVMIKENPNICNPIGLLIDKKKFENLDEFAKERYVTKLSNLYSDIIQTIAI